MIRTTPPASRLPIHAVVPASRIRLPIRPLVVDLIAVVLVIVAVQVRPANAAQPSSDSAEVSTPTAEDFPELHRQWQRLSTDIRGLSVQIRRARTDLERADRIRELSQTFKRTDPLLPRVVAAAKAAYLEDRDASARALLAYVAQDCFETDRYEIAADVALFLAENGFENKSIHNLAGLALTELLDLDRAEAQLQLAKQAGTIGPAGEDLLVMIPTFREELQKELDRRARDASADDLPRVEFETTRGKFVVELFENDVPNTVAHFVQLVEEGFYDGLPFYQVSQRLGAVVGCPEGTGQSGSPRQIVPELDPEKDRPHLRGSLSMVGRTGAPVDSKFLIVYHSGGTWRYNGNRTVFGRVIEGMDVASRLEQIDPLRPIEGLDPERILKAQVLRRRQHTYEVESTRKLAARHLQNAVAAIQKGEPEETVIAHMTSALEVEPKHFDTRYAYARYLAELDKHESAQAQYRRAIGLRPEHLDAHFYRGLSLVKLNRLSNAEEEFRAALEIKADDPRSVQNLGVVLAAQGRLEEAVEQFQDLVRLRPGDDDVRNTLLSLQKQLDEKK